MFNGIIETTGKIVSLVPQNGGARVVMDAGKLAGRLKAGDSIAVDGVCLTVVRKARSKLSIDVSAETWMRTNFAERAPGDVLNLELPLTATSFLSGHFVQGHVEGIGEVKKWIRNGEDVRLFIDIPRDLLPYCVPKGSIALNGVSLTIASFKGKTIGIALIPYTLSHTNLGGLQVGEKVNIETDIIGRYVVSAIKREHP